MRWFRRHRASVGRLALFTLCFQLALSLGHTHANPASIIAHAGVARDATLPDTAPDRDDSVCAVCALNSLIGSARAATAPVLPLPLVFTAALPAPLGATLAESRRAAFRSRAPPIA